MVEYQIANIAIAADSIQLTTRGNPDSKTSQRRDLRIEFGTTSRIIQNEPKAKQIRSNHIIFNFSDPFADIGKSHVKVAKSRCERGLIRCPSEKFVNGGYFESFCQGIELISSFHA